MSYTLSKQSQVMKFIHRFDEEAHDDITNGHSTDFCTISKIFIKQFLFASFLYSVLLCVLFFLITYAFTAFTLGIYDPIQVLELTGRSSVVIPLFAGFVVTGGAFVVGSFIILVSTTMILADLAKKLFSVDTRTSNLFSVWYDAKKNKYCPIINIIE